MLLKDQSTIITGAAGGLGLACAERFVAHGANVVISDINDDAGQAAAARLREAGHDVRYQHCDVTRRSDIDALIKTAVDAYGRLDCAIANAGIVHVGDALDLSEADFDNVMSVNLKGVFLTGQAAAKQMLKQSARADGETGSIINMSSVNGVLAIPEIAPYVVAKGGVNQWTRVLALRLAQHGVRVNAVGPGSMATDMLKTVAANPDKYRGVLSRTPMGRAGRPDEAGDVAVFLASSLSSYVTGQTIYPDGGRMFLNYTVPTPDPLPQM